MNCDDFCTPIMRKAATSDGGCARRPFGLVSSSTGRPTVFVNANYRVSLRTGRHTGWQERDLMTNLSERWRALRHGPEVPVARPGREAAKRALDIVVSMVALLVLAPLLVTLWLLVRSTSAGPGLFRQERLGRNMRGFSMLKLRTMYMTGSDQIHRDYVAGLLAGEQEAAAGPRGLLKLETDPRITPVGAWLRRTSLDELPQLFNVLKGEMSLVGPRPALPYEAEMWSSVYPEYKLRFEVRPGMTGLWQVSGRSRLSVREWLHLDADYVRRRSFGLDLVILARTLPALFRDGAS
jgi:lipopolysaccharide/colanic/teichoic acid biosynthesis glycosyltransferase